MMLHLVAIIAFLTLTNTSARIALNLPVDHFESPCPEYFNYFFEDNQLKYGKIEVECPEENIIQLNVEISVGNNVQGYNGDLEIGTSRAETIENIVNRRPITYRLFFPRWINIPPKVTKIILNDKLICSGLPINIKDVRVLTTINLQHTLKINIPPTHEQRLDPKPTLPAIHFNPTPPKDPTRIYPGNPFFNSVPPTDSEEPFFIEEDDRPYTERTFFHSTTEINLQPQQTRQPPHIHTRLSPVAEALRFSGVNEELCGRSVATNSLIANGVDVQKGQYPWLSAIFIIKDLGPTFLCGGNLISRRHVVTAGHCMKPSNKLLHVDTIFLRLGEHNLHQWTQVSESRTIGAAKIEVHPSYRSMSADADIAIITLADEVEYTKLIRPICVWSDSVDLNLIVGRLGRVVGWGKDESNSQFTPVPKQINFPVVSQEDCLRSHFTFREITSERTFCAGYRNGSGPCNGDSGGGFILNQGSRWTLRGIVSMSIAKDQSCDYSQYFVFSDVTKVMEWFLRAIS